MKKFNVSASGRWLGALKKAGLLLIIPLSFSGCKKTETELTPEPSASAKDKAGVSTVLPEFTIAVIPDTQYYTSSQNGGVPAMFTDQIDWIKTNRVAENIVYVASLGDITDHGNDVASEWTNASTNGYYKLETALTGLPNGIPYGTCVGNHDQTPNTGHPLTCSTSSYNAKFGKTHFSGRAYYGGNYSGSTSNDSHYDLFTVANIKFIVIYTEYDSHGDDGDNMNTWVYNLLGTYNNRKAIIVSHMMNDASGAWGTTGSSYAQGQELYDRIKSRTNVFMMLGGHFTGESLREDTYASNTIRTYLSDYQGWTNGGSGYMRLLKFNINANTVSVKTYSPYANVWQTDANSQFTKPIFTKGIEPAVAPPFTIANGYYKITNRNSLKAVVVSGASDVTGTQIIQYDYSNDATRNDEWQVAQLGNGYYRIINRKSGKDMNVNNGSYLNAASIIQYPYISNLDYNDEWSIVDVGSGFYKVVSRHSSFALNVDGASTANGAYIVQYPYTPVPQTEFQFTPIP